MTSAPAHASTEITAHYRSFDANAGGFQAIGAYLRMQSVQLSGHLTASGIEAHAAYLISPSPLKGIAPHLAIGAGYYQTASLLVGVGFNLHLFSIGSSKIGLRLDHMVYMWVMQRFQMVPWTIFGISYIF